MKQPPLEELLMYRVSVFFRKLTCFDTESIHSSDKFALSGVISSDAQEPLAFYMPTIRVNDNKLPVYVEREYEFYCDSPKFGISLVAWDLDSGDTWKESEADIKDVTKAIAAAAKLVPKYGTVISAVVVGVSAAVIETINIFNGWDKDDKLLITMRSSTFQASACSHLRAGSDLEEVMS
jgi:hypothetical protein